jgi:hypothetical protein
MPHSFKEFWQELCARCFILRRGKLFYVTPERLESLMQMAYRRGGLDSLIAQGEGECELLDNLAKEIQADNLHREYRQSVERPHFLSDGVAPREAMEVESNA